MTQIRIGDPAPDFCIAEQNGNEVALSSYRDKQVVVVFFYPRNHMPVCTAEACSFRDSYADFVAAGAVVLGVSSATSEKHRAFADRHQLPYPLLADCDGSLRKAFGVPSTLGVIPGRVTYVIDKQGIVRHQFNALFSAQRHVDEALKVVRELA